MDVYVINLKRHGERWQRMEAMLAPTGLRYHRVTAVEADRLPARWDQTRDMTPERYPISRGDIACVLSHRKAWRKFLRTSAPWCAILEDDACLSDDFSDLVRDDALGGGAFDLVKLETWWMEVIVYRPAGPAIAGRQVGELLSRHWGTAGYVIGRAAARRLLRAPRHCVPADWLLFDPFLRDARIAVGQLLPGAVIQLHRAHEAADAFLDPAIRRKFLTHAAAGEFASISAADAVRRKKRKRRGWRRMARELFRPVAQAWRAVARLRFRARRPLAERMFVAFR